MKNTDKIKLETNFDYSSSYSKKLEFIYKTIEKYSQENNKAIKRLDILEVGCGEGGITIPLSSLGCNIRAFDVDERTIANISKHLNNNKKINNIKVSVGDGYTFDDKAKYDIIIASEVFEHVTEPLKLASNIKKRMNANSQIIVTTPNGYGPWEIRNRLFIYPLTRNNSIRKLFHKPGYVEGSSHEHCQFFTKNELMNLFFQLNFKLKAFQKSDSIFAALPMGRRMGKLDIKIADILPSCLASGWYFSFELKD